VISGQGVFHVLDLLSGQVSPLTPILPEGASAVGPPLLGPDGSTTVSVVNVAGVDGVTRQVVVRSDTSGATVVFDTASADARIVSVTQSPNTQYLAIAVQPRPGAEIATSLVDRSSGAAVRTLAGLRVTWP
jgi:hypothetical protein